MESGPRKRVGEVRQKSGGGGGARRGAARPGLGPRGTGRARLGLVEGTPASRVRGGKVARRSEATLGLERFGERSFGRWDKDLLLWGRGRGGSCLLPLYI